MREIKKYIVFGLVIICLSLAPILSSYINSDYNANQMVERVVNIENICANSYQEKSEEFLSKLNNLKAVSTKEGFTYCGNFDTSKIDLLSTEGEPIDEMFVEADFNIAEKSFTVMTQAKTEDVVDANSV